MRRIVYVMLLVTIALQTIAQDVSQQLSRAVSSLEADTQMESALIGLYVYDMTGNKEIYNKNGNTGFAPASTQKILTAATAFEVLGSTYRYNTEVAYSGNISAGVLHGNIVIKGHGDPTLGSWRYDNSKDDVVFRNWVAAIKRAGIAQIDGQVIIDDTEWEREGVPGGWTWEDMGNYYGAGASAVNWHENQYDVVLRSGKPGAAVSISSTKPFLYDVQLKSNVVAGQAGSGDNAYIFLPPYSCSGTIRGTIPPYKSAFVISGALPDAAAELGRLFTAELGKNHIEVKPYQADVISPAELTALATQTSPALDSIVYWFLKKSVNLYGEALLKTMGYATSRQGSTKDALKVIQNFWQKNGIRPAAINIIDGSGLSPANRVTPAALVEVLKYSRQQAWYPAFYNALPELNGIRMKSGTIGGAKSFAGYVGRYAFSIIVNNYNGPVSEVVQKMYRVLNLLK